MAQLAQDKGITQVQLQTKVKDARTQQLKTQLQALVDKRVITQAQADQRLSYLQTLKTNVKGKAGGRRHMGGMMGY